MSNRYFGLQVPFVHGQKIDGVRTLITDYDAWGEKYVLLLDPPDIDEKNRLVRVTIHSFNVEDASGDNERDNKLVAVKLPKPNSNGREIVAVERERVQSWTKEPKIAPTEGEEQYA